MLRSLALCALAAGAAACTSMPQRFTPVPELDSNFGYVERARSGGIELETFYCGYDLLGNPSPIMRRAIELFREMAAKLASEQGRAIETIHESDLSVTTSQNDLDGYHSVFVRGFAPYQEAVGQ